MILFKQDWNKYPGAIIDLTTKNKSFVRLAGLLREMGIKNNTFMLALHNPRIKGLNPHDEDNLTLDQKIMIAEEVAINPWYYFREVVKAPALSGTEPTPYRANRFNIALYWLFFTHVMVLGILGRQQGKSFGMDVLNRGILNFWTQNTSVTLITKSNDLRMENIERLKKIELTLPTYLRMTTKKDANNTQYLTVNRNDNKLNTIVAQKSRVAANSAGRGNTSPIIQVDEGPFITFVEYMIPAALASGGEAVEAARKNGMPYGTIFTTTAGDPSTESGEYMYGVYENCAIFNEILYDMKDEAELHAWVEKHARGVFRMVLIEYNHNQLGYSDEWLADRIRRAGAKGAAADRDFFNKWVSAGEDKPIDANVLRMIDNYSKDPVYVEVTKHGYTINWYIPKEDIEAYKTRALVAGMDTSNAIGKDDIGMKAVDPYTGRTVFTGKYNDVNLGSYAEFIADLTIMFEDLLWVVENRSSAMGIMDTVAKIIIPLGINPFRRMFNWVVNDGKDEVIKEVLSAKNRTLYDLYIQHKKDFGYATSGGGRSSRDNLYNELEKSLKYIGNVLYDKSIITQINKLVRKNGRIDHGPKDHDDLVIAHMLSWFFLTQANNTDIYNINSKRILRNINIIDSDIVDDIAKEEQREALQEIYDYVDTLLEELSNVNNIYQEQKIVQRIKKIESDLNLHGESMNLGSRIEEIIESKRKR